MAYSITDLKKNTIFAYDNEPYRVIEYNQKVMGRGGSIVNVKIKSLVDGKVLVKTFKGNEQVETANVKTISTQYLYKDSGRYIFMDDQNFEQHEVAENIIGDSAKFIKEGDQVNLQTFNGRIINLDLPKNLPLKVTYTEAAVRGDTSSSITKNATLETGLVIKVPAFIKQGDSVSVDTETASYRERIKG